MHSSGMDTQQPPEGISTEEWAATPETVRVLITSLLHTVKQLEQNVADLEERLNQHSGNSSKPPSSDPPYQRRTIKRKESGRKRGGQPGHIGSVQRDANSAGRTSNETSRPSWIEEGSQPVSVGC